ncbi:unnamed protein product [Lymnaea stagnalis]|uniref:Cytochrome P450 n=1 Tax=Lymnaea stagnalis TaxID=6523 RepID=A0AAV2HXV0_LYMST
MYLTLLIVAAILALLAVLFVRVMSANHDTFRKMGIDTPPTSRILGNFGLSLKYGIFGSQTVFYKQFKDKKVYGWYESRRPILIVKDLDMVKEILVKKFNCFVNRFVTFDTEPPFRDNLFILRGDHWKQVRTLVSPTFSSAKIKTMSSHIERNAKIMLDNLQQKQDSSECVELREYCSYFTLDVIASTAFGLEINTLKDPKNKFVASAKALLNPNPLVYALVLLLPELAKVLSMLGVSVLPQKPLDYLASVVDVAIEERKRDDSGGKINDFLDLLMRAEVDQSHDTEIDAALTRNELTRSEIHAQAIIFIFAGYDTVATVMSFTLFLLAVNPECVKKVQAEIDEQCGKDVPNHETVQGLTYLEMCISESMRLFPPATLLVRECVQDAEIQGIHIPKDMKIFIPVYAIHTDPEQFPEPDKFDPQRFTTENKASRHPYAYLPFGFGPRSCIGMRLAIVEMKIAIAAVLQKLIPVVCSKTVFPLRLSKIQTKADDGLWVKFEKRNEKI